METITRNHTSGQFFVGIVLIIVGALVLANNLDFIYVDHIGRYWPVLFILIGLAKLFNNEADKHRGSGLGWIFLGAWLLVSTNRIWGFDFHNSWPILIVGWGVSMLWKGVYDRSQLRPAEEHFHGN